MSLRKVVITITNKVVGQYEARSYPHDSMTSDNFIELYKVPVYDIIIAGKDDAGADQSITWTAPRFFPYWNDPVVGTNHHYKTKGWVNSGLSSGRTIVVSRYIRDYEVQNRYSPGLGAIVLVAAFYIHGGPAELTDYGFGSAGCVEIIGNYNRFKADVASLSGSASYAAAKPDIIAGGVIPPGAVTHCDDAIDELVRNRKLTVVIQATKAPDIKKNLSRTVPTTDLFPAGRAPRLGR